MGLLPLALLLLQPAAAQQSSYRTPDAAAVGFAALVKDYPDQSVEYCAWIVKRGEGDFFLTATRTGTRDSCPSGSAAPSGTAGSVHTHPFRRGEGDRVDSVVQVFSEGDINHAEFAPAKPNYMIAPYGHILRYDPGGSLCKGSSWIARRYTIVRDAPQSVRGRLMTGSGDFVSMYGPNGQRTMERPSYCRDAPR